MCCYGLVFMVDTEASIFVSLCRLKEVLSYLKGMNFRAPDPVLGAQIHSLELCINILEDLI